MRKKWLNKNKKLFRTATKLIPLKYLEESMWHPSISIHETTYIHKNAYIKSEVNGNIFIGRNCIVSHGALLISYKGNITIGDNVTINPYSILYGHGGLTIGDNVRIAAHCVIIPANHIFDGISPDIGAQGVTQQGIVIENGVWLGAGVRVLDGVTIRKGCVIGAGSVVTKSTEAGGVYVGAPAKIIRFRR